MKIKEFEQYKRKNYSALDVAKFVCAIFIISAHFASEWATFPALVDYAFSIYIIAVPFFFCCSGFLFFKKIIKLDTKEEQKRYFLSYQKRIWIMYGIWTLIYVPFIVLDWIKKGICNWTQFLKWLHMATVIQTYSTIWFLPALAIGVALTYLIICKVKNCRVEVVICVILYFLGTWASSYSFLFQNTVVEKIITFYLQIFKTSRNALFNAVPYIYMGYVFSKKDIVVSRNKFLINAMLVGVFLILIVLESFLLKLKFGVTGMDFIYMLVQFTYFFIKALLSIHLKEREIYIWCRKLSLLMFVSQRLFLNILPFLMPDFFNILYSNNWFGLLSVLILTISFSVFVVKISKKLKFLKWIM